MDNKELEAIADKVMRGTKAKHVAMIIITDGRLEIVAATQQMDTEAESRLNLANVLQEAADEIKDGGGMPLGNDGEIIVDP